MIHAGAISKNGKAILLAGRSGAGKSSLSYRGIQYGWKFMGDDLVAIGGLPKPRVFNLYSTVKLFTDSIDPQLQGTSIEKWREKDGKTVFRLDLLNFDVFAQVAELSAVVLVDRSFKPGVVEEISPASVVSIIGASTHHVLPSSSKITFSTLSESIRSIKCWRFHPDNDLESYKVLESILE